MKQNEQIETINSLVGEMTEEQLLNLSENLESYVHPDLSLFVPIFRFCEYAVTPNHVHPAYSFIYCIDLKGHLLIKGQRKEPDRKKKAFICAFSPDVPHQEITEAGFSNYIAIFVGKNYFEEKLAAYGRPDGLSMEGAYFPLNDTLLILLKTLMFEYNKPKTNTQSVIASLNELITNMLIRIAIGEEQNPISIHSQHKVDLAIAFMYENIHAKLVVNDIAGHIGQSPSHFSKLFKEVTEKTPIEYLTDIRVEKAKRLLKLSDKNLTEIAFDCGFTSSSYFSYCFVEKVRLTPSEYRKKFNVH